MLLPSLASDCGMWAWWCSTRETKTILFGEPGQQTVHLRASYASCRRHLDFRLGPEVLTSPKRRKASRRAGRGTVQPQLHSGIADWRVAFLGRVKNWPDPFPKESVLRFISSVEFMNLRRYQDGPAAFLYICLTFSVPVPDMKIMKIKMFPWWLKPWTLPQLNDLSWKCGDCLLRLGRALRVSNVAIQNTSEKFHSSTSSASW